MIARGGERKLVPEAYSPSRAAWKSIYLAEILKVSRRRRVHQGPMSRADTITMAAPAQAALRRNGDPARLPAVDQDTSDDDQASDVEINVDGVPEKDETEEELERLVFGDGAGFRAALARTSVDEDAEAQDQDDDGMTGLEGLDDAQVGQIALKHGALGCSNAPEALLHRHHARPAASPILSSATGRRQRT